jgi:hypothetical protein
MITPARMEGKILENVSRITNRKKIMTYVLKSAKKGHSTST